MLLLERWLLNLDLFDDSTSGIFRILDDSIRMSAQSTTDFIDNVFSKWKGNPNLTRPKSLVSKIEGFVIRHFAGDVYYNVVSSFTCIVCK